MCLVTMLMALGLGGAGPSQAQVTRPAAFTLSCNVPLTQGLHTRASLVGKIKFTNRTVRFAATCFDGPSASSFPDVYMSDGKAQVIDLAVVTSVENADQQEMAQNNC